MSDYRDINDPDEYILKICHLLFYGESKPRIRHKMTVQQRNGKFEAIIDLIINDADNHHKTITRRVEVGEGPTVAKARANLLKKLVARAQAVIDLPVQQIMES